jgi:hypothetical protein
LICFLALVLYRVMHMRLKGRFPRRSAGGRGDVEGFSDHLPITFTIREG